MNLHSVWAEISSSSCTQTVTFLIFGHLNSDLDLHCWFSLIPQFSGLHTQTVVSLPFLVFHPWDSRSWDSSVFKTMWTKSYKFFPIYTLLICFSGELWDNHVLLVFSPLSINAVHWCFFFIIVYTFYSIPFQLLSYFKCIFSYFLTCYLGDYIWLLKLKTIYFESTLL